MATPRPLVSAKPDLRFIGEGNEHIVFSLSNTCLVLRFRKFPFEETISRDEFMLRVTSDLSFINDVARPLAGPLLLDKAELVSLDPDFLLEVMEKIKPLRDEKRLFKVINKFGIAVSTPNVATDFMYRRSVLGTRPEILKFSFSEDVITIHPQLFLDFSNASCTADFVFRESQRHPINSQEQLPTTESHPEGKSTPSADGVHRLEPSVVSGVRGSENPNEESHEGIEGEEESHGNEPDGADNEYHDDSEEDENTGPPPQTLCIELKPKQGFLELGPRESFLCRFCLKQYLKLSTKTEAFRSAYCPQDLFSGKHSLMVKAVQNLFEAPQNNLKIFSNGKRVQDLKQYKHFSELLVLILTYDEGKIGTPDRDDAHGTNPSDRALLPQGSLLSPFTFLGKILYLQSLGSIPETQAGLLYKELNKRIPCEEELHKYLSEFEFLKNIKGKSPTSAREPFKSDLSSLETPVIRQLIQQCLVTMSAKDASLMMLIEGPFKSFQQMQLGSPVPDSPFWLSFPPNSCNWYKCQVSLVDVALKKPIKIIDHGVALGRLEDILDDLKGKDQVPSCCERITRNLE